MLQRRIDFFLDLIFTPTGVLLIVGLIACIVILFKNSDAFWFFLSALALVSSFSEFRNEFVDEAPPLAGPLQLIRTYGRTLAIFLLILLAIYCLLTSKSREKVEDHYGITKTLFFIQSLILFKNLFYGNSFEGILAFFVFVVVMFVFWGGVNHFLTSQKRGDISIIAFAVVVLVFNLFSFYQSRVDFSAMLFPAGQFLGMTGNAQHAAVLLASSIPLFVFLILSVKSFYKLVFVVGLLSTLYYLLLTASRTGMVMAASGFLMMGLFGGAKSLLRWSLVAVVVLIVLTIFEYSPLEELNSEALEHLTSTENSRGDVIDAQLNMFNNNIFFGADPRGRRVGFGESSYFGVAASLGIIGLIPLIILMIGCVRLLIKLIKTSFVDKHNRQKYLMVVGGLVPLLLGALVEAYLLGIVTWPLIMFLMYVSWGNQLLMQSKSQVTQ